MTLVSFGFLAFLAVVYVSWRYAARGDESRRWVLLAASYYFYATWDGRFLAILLLTTLAQWALGRAIGGSRRRPARLGLLALSIVLALGTLGYFKYAAFLVDSAARFLGGADPALSRALASVVAPIGISFFTFMSLTFTIDAYRGSDVSKVRLRDFALFVAFFPHVTAGPIDRARDLIPQLKAARGGVPDLDFVAIGLILRGLAKKLVFADVLAANFVAPAMATPTEWSPAFLFVSLAAYSFQIYMDLSGYTDLARGAARCFGYRLAVNFDRPYLATSVSNFWQRWHMSMSGFFREYLYYSMGGSRHGNVYLNLMLTFVAIGIWHGAGWNFILYGAVHGSAVCIERWRRKRRDTLPGRVSDGRPGSVLVSVLLTFAFVSLARILFVQADVSSAANYVVAMVRSTGAGGAAGWQGYLTLLGAAALHVSPRSWQDGLLRRLEDAPIWWRALAMVAAIVMIVALAAESRPFTYYRF
jgi:alginate O-acetyltransferase complex protein AlgI